MPKPDPIFFQLQQMIIDLSLIERNHYLAKTDKRENDIEHSMMVAMLCWYIHDKNSLNLDLSKIFKYALAHDFVERYAGDVNTFASSDERAHKIKMEQESLKKLSSEFHEFSGMVVSMEQYEAKEDEESLFVWTVDKMQALVMGDLDDWRPYSELSISYEQFCNKYEELLGKSSKYAHQVFEGLISYSKTTYYDK